MPVILQLLLPIIVLTLVLGTVAVVALCRARQEDIYKVLREGLRPFDKIADHLPNTDGRKDRVPIEDPSADPTIDKIDASGVLGADDAGGAD